MYLEDLYEPVRRIRWIFLGITLLTLAIVFFVSRYIGKSLSKPIKKLDECASAIRDGKPDVQIPEEREEREDEIGNLAKTFNAMVKKVKTSRKALEKEKEIAEAARKKAEKARKNEEEARKNEEEARKKAEKANRVKSEFLSNMNHEIRSPLTSILGNIEMLMPLTTDEVSREYLQDIKYNCITLNEFIDNILYKSAAEILESKGLTRRPKIETVYLCSLLREIRGSFSYRITRKNLQYYPKFDEDMPQYLKLDKTRIKQVVINLLSNAVKYTEKGHIKLIVKMENLTGDTADLIITVEDTGPGIAEENKEKVFNAFQQLDNGGDGLGLGLHIAKEAVEKMGGQISLESEVGKGSVFTIHLKNITVSRKKPEDYVDDDIDISLLEFEGQRILVVDDRANHRRVFKNYLKGMNLSVLEAEDGETALQMAEEYRPDVVIMDLDLGPGKINGIRITEKIKEDEDLKNTIVIALSAKSSLLDMDECKKWFDRRLTKPIERDRFIFELSRVLTKCKEQCPIKGELDLLGQIELPEENQKNLPQIVKKLDEYRSLWENASKSGNFDQFKSFGIKIKEIGRQFEIKALSEYGEKLVKSVEMFSIAKIKMALNYYPTLIDNLKNRKKKGQKENDAPGK
jgi:two-component system sensor histidine kinase EvgS